VNVTDPVRYPLPVETTDGLRQEAQRARVDLARTMEELADRLSTRRLVRPAVLTLSPVLTGLAVAVTASATLRRFARVRRVAWLGGLVSGVVAAEGARRIIRAGRIVPGASPAAEGVEDLEVEDLVAGEQDVVTVLREQHRRIERAFTDVLAAEGYDRLELFATLVELLRQHEHAEQRFVHPLLRLVASDLVDARLAEETSAERALSSLMSRGVGHPDFESGLVELRRLVLHHTAQEESREFPLLRAHVDVIRRRELASALRWSG
jgi:hypothetical protein